jgi:hypothetical protein
MAELALHFKAQQGTRVRFEHDALTKRLEGRRARVTPTTATPTSGAGRNV